MFNCLPDEILSSTLRYVEKESTGQIIESSHRNFMEIFFRHFSILERIENN